jgi:membrane protein
VKWNLAGRLTALDDAIWGPHPGSGSRGKAHVIRLTRLVVVLARDLAQGQLTLRAMSLVYTTLLSIVPLLALSFSVLKAFGVYNQIQPMLLTFLEPLGEKGIEITSRIIQFIQNMNVGVLGSVGLALLLYTAVSLVQKIEESFNFIWHVDRSRGVGERFSRYLSALFVGPILLFAALGMTAAVMSMEFVRGLMQFEPVGWIVQEGSRLVPYLLMIGAFTFVYMFIPNTRVRLWPALAGGIVGGILWQSAGWVFALFVAGSTKYAAIYSGLAILILFMIWLHLSWLILLFGASVAFYIQHPEYRVQEAGEPQLSNRMRERLALVLMSMIARRHLEQSSPWTGEALAQAIHVPLRSVRMLLGVLAAGGVLVRTSEEPSGYVPARDLETITVKQLLETVRTIGENRFLNVESLPAPEMVEDVMRKTDRAVEVALGGMTIKELAGAPTAALGQSGQSGQSAPRAASA